MSVLIKGMEMPKTCGDCLFSTLGMDCMRLKKDISKDWAQRQRPYDCPLVEVKSPHGDLIDRDALLFDNSEAFYDIDWYTNAAWEAVDNAPTVLEADCIEEIVGYWIRNNIQKIPAADVRPVVRGRWVDGKCDNCGEHAPYWCLATTFHESNYCPNCGAKMEEIVFDEMKVRWRKEISK